VAKNAAGFGIVLPGSDMVLKPIADVTVDSTTDEDLDEFFDELDEIDEFEDMGLCYPDGRYHSYDETLKQIIEVHPDGRRFVMLKKGYSVERGPEIL